MPELLRVSSERSTLSVYGPETRDDVSPSVNTGSIGRVDVRALRAGAQISTEMHPELDGDSREKAAPPLFFENTDYDLYLEGIGTEGPVEIRHRDPRLLRRVHARQERRAHGGAVNFGSAVGLSTFTVWVGGQPEFDLTIKVFPTKLDFESDREDMIEEIQRDLGAIALRWLSATYGFGAATRGSPTDLEWTLLLRHAIDDLDRGLREVARHPRRQLVRESQEHPAHRVRRPDAAVRSALTRSSGQRAIGTLANGLSVPRRLPVNTASSTLDTPEHRWFASRLGLIRRRLAHIRAIESARRSHRGGDSAGAAPVLAELQDLGRRIERLAALPPIAAAVGPPVPGYSSLQLMTATGYGLAYRACMTLDLALRIQDGVVQLAEKGMDRLYEYWAFLRIVRGVERAVDGRADARALLGVESSGLHVRPLEGRQTTVNVRAKRGARVGVAYNPQFADRQLTLVAQRPDVLITYEETGWPSQCLVIDAKYRLDSSPAHVSTVGQPAPPDDALNVLYRYRDAILERADDGHSAAVHTVIEAAAVYPFSPPDTEVFRASRLWASLEGIGVGAIPLLPGREAWLDEWFRRTLGRGAWSLADRAIAHRSSIAAQTQLQRVHELALVGVVPRESLGERLAWHRSQRVYFLPQKEVPRLRAVRWVALYAPGSMSESGRVEWVAPVLEIRTGRRGDLHTPWVPSRDADEQVLVFELGEFDRLPRPIENLDGQRPPPYRWATYLALTRARDLSELSIETVQEWRLHQQLLAEGIPFVVRPGDKSHPPGDDQGRGAATFIVEDGAAIRHRPNRGYRVRWGDGRVAEAVSVDGIIAHFRQLADGFHVA